MPFSILTRVSQWIFFEGRSWLWFNCIWMSWPQNTLSASLSPPEMEASLDHSGTLVPGSEPEGRNVTVTFLLQSSCLSAPGFCSELFNLVANSADVYVHVDGIALISLGNTQVVKGNCCCKTRFRGPCLRLRAIREALPWHCFHTDLFLWFQKFCNRPKTHGGLRFTSGSC